MSKMNTSKRRKEKEFNPALRIRDFYSFSLQILNEINYAREHPDEFIEKIKELKEAVEDSKDNCLYIENVPFVYNNLLGSLDNSIEFLEKQKELPRLNYNKTITQACDFLLDELISHDGLDDENANDYSLENRLNKFGYPLGDNYELIDYGMFDPEFIVINFVLGDGDKNKFERNVIFNPKVKYIGIASGILPSDKICTIINCCEEFFEKNEKIPPEIERKFNRKDPSFYTKTINNYSGKSGNSTNVERYTSNTKKEGNVEEQFTEEINTKRGDSGDVFSVKKTEYIKRRESIKDSNKDKDKKKDARIPLRNKKTKNEPKNFFDVFDDEDEDFDEDNFFDKEFDIHFGKDFGKNNNKSSKKVTTTTTTTDDNGLKKTVVTTITEEIDGKGGKKREYYEEKDNKDDDKRIKSRKNKVKEREEREREREREKEKERKEKEKREIEEQEREEEEERKRIEKERNERKERQRQRELEKKREYEENLEKEKKENPKYKKKIIEIPIKLKPKKEDYSQYDDESSKYGTYKTVQDYPSHKKGYYEKEFEREEEEIENEYPTDYREKKSPKFKISEDMYEKEEDMELPEGAINMQVKQKTITDSKGVPALIIKKTITYEDGSVKTIIDKKPIKQK